MRQAQFEAGGRAVVRGGAFGIEIRKFRGFRVCGDLSCGHPRVDRLNREVGGWSTPRKRRDRQSARDTRCRRDRAAQYLWSLAVEMPNPSTAR